jgi:succinyl-diaminopimelate desuccinylase
VVEATSQAARRALHTAERSVGQRSALDRALAGMADRLEEGVADLAEMVAVDTSFPPGLGYDAFADLMERLVEPLGFATERVVVPEALWQVPHGPARGRRTNLIAARRTGRPVCSLYFHVDTVPPADGWTSDPFRLARDGDRLVGLGAADMKGCVAAVLLALRAAEREGVPLAYDPVLLLCTDEEAGLYPGVRHLAEGGRVEGHVVNFNGSAEPRVWAGCFGLVTLLVRIEGRTVHPGDGAGRNAIEGALPVLAALEALKPRVAALASALPAPPHAQGPLRPSLTIAAAHGGTCAGQVPARFEITVCRRYAPEEARDSVRAEVEAVIRAAVPDGLSVEIDLIGDLAPTADPDGPHWPRWQRAVGLGFGYAPEDFARWGAASCSDFGWVQRATGRAEVLLGGLGRPERRVHAPGEHTTGADLVGLARAVLAYLAVDFEPDLNPDLNPDLA